MPDYPNGKEPDLKSGDGVKATAGSNPVSGAALKRYPPRGDAGFDRIISN